MRTHIRATSMLKVVRDCIMPDIKWSLPLPGYAKRAVRPAVATLCDPAIGL